MDPHEPYWRTNTSFSPPPSRWDFQVQSEVAPYSFNEGNQVWSSISSNSSSSSRRWVRSNRLYDLHHYAADGPGLYLGSPSDLSQGPQWPHPAIQEISDDDIEMETGRDPSAEQILVTSVKEATSENIDSQDSSSSHSGSSESEPTVKSCLSGQWNSSRRSFISKPIHPLSFNSQTSTREAIDSAIAGLSEFDAAPSLRDIRRWSNASSNVDFADVSDSIENETSSGGFRCNLCERLLSQRSPWSTRRIVRSGDMPITGILSCCHVFHAECLEQTTPKTRTGDPPCPLCLKLEGSPSDQRGLIGLRSAFPKLRPVGDNVPSMPWGCAQAGDCVEGTLQASPRHSLVLLNRNRVKKNLTSEGKLRKEFPGKLKRFGSYSSPLFTGRPVDQGAVGCSKAPAVHSMSR